MGMGGAWSRGHEEWVGIRSEEGYTQWFMMFCGGL